MYPQPLTQTLTTEEFFRSLNSPTEDTRKLTLRDAMMTVAQVLGVLALCVGLHVAFT